MRNVAKISLVLAVVMLLVGGVAYARNETPQSQNETPRRGHVPVTICHYGELGGVYHLITVDEHALSAHKRHGLDCFPDEGEDCSELCDME